MRKLFVLLASASLGCGSGSQMNRPSANAGSSGAAESGANGEGGAGAGAGAGATSGGSTQAMAGAAGSSVPMETAKPTTTLPLNQWVDITPMAMRKTQWVIPGHGCAQPGDVTPTSVCTYGAGAVQFDLHAPGGGVDAYVATNMLGLWRQSSSGEWSVLGDPSATQTPQNTTYLPQIFDIKIDPADSNHMYLTSGVQGPQHGFYVSHDRGKTWVMPQGFIDFAKAVGTDDTTVIDVDPLDFSHILVSSHSDWSTTTEYSSGIGESRDGGATWVPQIPAGHPWGAGTKTVLFLHHPKSGQGNGDTWLVGDEQAGFWRTEDAGKNWKQVSTQNSVHGGPGYYYTSAGVLYVGAFGTPLRSKDNGKTFEPITSLGTKYYFAITGDGDRLYTRPWTESGPYLVSPETDGTTWTPLVAGNENPTGDTFYLQFDPINRVLYSANHVVETGVGTGGVYALRLPPR